MFLLDAPPDTVKYLIAGYSIGFTVLAIFLISLFVRWNGLKRELEMLQELEKDVKK
jgi:hypothetical protein